MATGIPKTKWRNRKTESARDVTKESDQDFCLSYTGKKSEHEILRAESEKVILAWKGRSRAGKGTQNRLYYGDNLPLLAALLRDPNVRGHVKLVYIDPPFATKSVFLSRSQADAYRDVVAGARYIEWLRERLVFLRELLSEDGSIYLHLDDNMAFVAKVVMDEVFGGRNFRNWITRKKCNPKNYTRRTYGNVSDFILFYSKSDSYIWNRPVETWTSEHPPVEYHYVEKETGRRYMKVPIHAPGTRNGETGKPWRGMLPPPGKHWQFPPKALDQMDARGEIYWSPSGNPRRKIYLDEKNGRHVQDIWLDFRDAHNQNIEITGYPTEKNPALLERIIRASSCEGDLVLDCFSGSGTSLVVASKLGRKWIGIDSSPLAIKTTLRRLAKGSETMGDFVGRTKSDKLTQNKRPLTLPLFSPSESDKLSAVEFSKRTRITDFDLFSMESRNQDLGNILMLWNEWLSTSCESHP